MPDREVFELAMQPGGPAVRRRAARRARQRATRRLPGGRRAPPPIDDHALRSSAPPSERVALAIASGAFRREIEHVLRSAGVSDHFQVVVSIDDVRQGKPDPEGFRYALAQLNSLTAADPPIAPEETVAVEDATDGARAARAAGMRVAAIRGVGYDEDERLRGHRSSSVSTSAALEQMLALPEHRGERARRRARAGPRPGSRAVGRRSRG